MDNAVDSPVAALREAQVWPLSVAAYHVLGEAGLIPKSTELLYGTVYRKMAKSPYHSALVGRLASLLGGSLPPGFFTRIEQPITCRDSEPEPDLAVIRGNEKDFWEQHPRTAELIIEVCVTSHEYDRSKLRAYASAGVKECWLVLGPEKQIEVYRSSADGAFAEHSLIGLGGTVTSTAVPGLALSLDALFTK